MEARQRVKLSLTNRSIGLISLTGRVPRSSKPARTTNNRPHKHPSDASHQILEYPQRHANGVSRRPLGRLVDLVVIARGPHPIPSRTRP